jgi:cytoskeletal protein CcmA (bactofilin family)
MGIFGKGPDAKPAELPPHAPGKPAAAPASARPALCVVGAKTTVKGELVGEEDVVIEGTVEGEVRIAKDLRVSQGGSVKAKVSAQSVVLAGEMVGDCHASQKVEITSTGRLTGDIRAPKIVIAEGAVFKGNSDMSGPKDQRKEHPAAS